jgi:hypothetical protein
MHIKTLSFLFLCHIIGFGPIAQGAESAAQASDPLDQYNVVWQTPSRNSSGSMPIGNGDIGLNVWVEEDGDLLFYISKTDAWNENVRLLKLGRVRIALSPNPFLKGKPFLQTLRLRQGEIEIRGGEKDSEIILRIWVDANQPVIRVEAAAEREFSLRAKLEVWRDKERTLQDKELFSAYGMNGAPNPVVEYPDTILLNETDRILWFHRNEKSVYSLAMKLQGLESLLSKFADPLLHRTFGGAIKGEGLIKETSTTLRTMTPRRRYSVSIYPLTRQTETRDEWRTELSRSIDRVDATNIERAREAHQKWWKEFWDRSWIRVSGASPAPAMTTNTSPLRLGADSDGRNQFVGRVREPRVFNRALKATEIETLASGQDGMLKGDSALVGYWQFDRPRNGVFPNAIGNNLSAKTVGSVEVVGTTESNTIRLTGRGWLEIPNDPRLTLTKSCTLAAWIAPEQLPSGGARIIDKSLAGTSNGYLLDTYPGRSLRMIVEPNTLIYDAKLPLGKWSHVAATYDTESGEQKLYLNGKEVASANLGGNLPKVSQAYALQRFINACAGRGAFPIKFNGSIFTVDPKVPGETYDADYRRWGGPYWFQNTRLPYWPMVACGDFDLMQPLFRMYRDALPLAKARTPLYFGHEGAFFPETIYFWGVYANENYGWNRKGKPSSHVDNTYIRYYWSGGLELTAMMLDYYIYTKDESYLNDTLLPFAEAIIHFYDLHYSRDAQGKILIKPSQALETWQQATNPLPPVAGLRFVLDKLLSLPGDPLTAAQRADWERLRREIPDLPAKREGNKTILLPADEFSDLKNSENPELYAIFPYRLYGLNKPDLETGHATFANRRIKGTGGWRQDAIQAAYLGLTDTAAAYTVHNFSTFDRNSRFPAFWGPNFDWVPDQDHGGVAMMALQTMLMQCEGEKIYLFPAWPKGWNVELKLHAPANTTVEAAYHNGKLELLNVTPKSRNKDIINLSVQTK